MRTAHYPAAWLAACLAVALPASAAQGPLAPAARPDAAAREQRATRITVRCSTLLDEIVRRGAPGISVALRLADGVEVAVTAGFADVEAAQPMRPSDRMLSGSVGKTYVAAAALRLAALGRLDLDARAASFFREDTPLRRLANWDAITVRQLLRHQSGLPRYVFEPAFWEIVIAEPDKVWRPEDELAFVFDRPALFAAGEGWGYADTNYLVVGLILERVTGERFNEHARKALLVPAGLVDTVPSDSRRIEGLIQGTCRALAGVGVPERVLEDGVFVINPQFEGCGGGYASTPRDLARWARRLFSGAAFEGEYLPAMLDSVPADAMLGRGARYGLGVIVHPTALGELRGHEGIMTGYLAGMGWFPAHDIAVAVQLNTDDQRPLGRSMVDLLVALAAIAVEETRAAGAPPGD